MNLIFCKIILRIKIQVFLILKQLHEITLTKTRYPSMSWSTMYDQITHKISSYKYGVSNTSQQWKPWNFWKLKAKKKNQEELAFQNRFTWFIERIATP